MAFPKHQRIKDTKSIARLLRETRPIHEGGISLRVATSDKSGIVVAVLVPKNAAVKAVVRNALRRRVTEALREMLTQEKSVDHKKLVVTVRSVPAGKPALHDALVLLLKKSGILHQ